MPLPGRGRTWLHPGRYHLQEEAAIVSDQGFRAPTGILSGSLSGPPSSLGPREAGRVPRPSTRHANYSTRAQRSLPVEPDLPGRRPLNIGRGDRPRARPGLDDRGRRQPLTGGDSERSPIFAPSRPIGSFAPPRPASSRGEGCGNKPRTSTASHTPTAFPATNHPPPRQPIPRPSPAGFKATRATRRAKPASCRESTRRARLRRPPGHHPSAAPAERPLSPATEAANSKAALTGPCFPAGSWPEPNPCLVSQPGQRGPSIQKKRS